MPDPRATQAARRRADARRRTIAEQYAADVETYVDFGGDEQVQRVMTAVNRVSKQLERWYDERLAEVGLTAGEWVVLTRLATAEGGPMTPSQLAEQSSVSPSSMTHRLDKLTDKGLVLRAPDPENRSRVMITLSRDGWEMFRRAVGIVNFLETDVLAGVSAQQREQLADLLDLVILGMDTVADGPTTATAVGAG